MAGHPCPAIAMANYSMPKKTPRFTFATATPAPRLDLKPAYGSEWRKLRDKRINAEPLCRHCKAGGLVTPAVEVDHIIPRALGGKDEWDNTQSLCKSCHQDKTRQDIKLMAGRRRD
jgi:5-methylcytosine-specific restriction protein A